MFVALHPALKVLRATEKEKFESPARLRFIPLPRANDGRCLTLLVIRPWSLAACNGLLANDV